MVKKPVPSVNCKKYALLAFLLPMLIAWAQPLPAQHGRVSVGFYNAENLFDTVPSPFYDDSEYTPQGRNGWNTERYRRKLANLARVIDEAGFDVLGLAEVENEEAVRDLVAALKDDYTYIHRTSGDRRGIDLALLYKGDKFFPDEVKLIRSETTREFLFVKGSLIGVETGILVCHLPSKFNGPAYRKRAARRLAQAADSIAAQTPCSRLIVMGDLNGELHETPMREAFGKSVEGRLGTGGFYNALHECASQGYGSYCWDGEWFLYDNILVSAAIATGESLRLERGGIFVREFMLDGTSYPAISDRRRRGYPLRTFSSGRYLGGYSDHLPVFAVFAR